ncbi:MAG TPA: Crp/Fnr family transcriptional regulator [Candidatus Binataceae bacterium]|nr:Crp/Fnr family transcriptional regulator [Candidatus Binataceae bacterium]
MNSQPTTPGQSRLLELLEQWGLPKEAIAGLVGRHTLVRYPKRSPLFLQGSPADVAFAVFTGLVKVYCPVPEGSRILVHLAGPGDLIGYADFLDPNRQRSQMFEAHALTSCSVALFTRQHVLKLLRGLDPGVLLGLLETLNGFWSAMVHRYAIYLSMSLRERLQMVLADLGARFGVQDARGVLLTPELAQEELAEMIGSSRPMVSKLLSEMAEHSMIACQGRRYILLRGSGLDTPSRWLLPTASRSHDEGPVDKGGRIGVSTPRIHERRDEHLVAGGPGLRSERAAGAI